MQINSVAPNEPALKISVIAIPNWSGDLKRTSIRAGLIESPARGHLAPAHASGLAGGLGAHKSSMLRAAQLQTWKRGSGPVVAN